MNPNLVSLSEKICTISLPSFGCRNGMLSRNELGRFGSGMLTDVFIDRPRDEMRRGGQTAGHVNSDKLGKH